MAAHNKTGILGEEIAAQYLLQKGYRILERNWRWHRTEVDIICEINQELIFVEVKARHGTAFGYPEEAVTPTKQQAITKAANAYLEGHSHFTTARFDIIAIDLVGDSPKEIVHLKDAFY